MADELQLLARKVISKKPDFRVNLDNMMKQRYASQLYDRSNVSIAKALLLQMPNVSFTQYRNELARVLGTRQRPSMSVSTKSVSVTPEGTESGEEEKPAPKSQHKRDSKIKAQSSQIKNLREKLDGAIAENCTDQGMAEPQHSANGVHQRITGIWTVPFRWKVRWQATRIQSRQQV